MEYRITELQHDVFQTNIDEASPPDPTISGGFKHVFAAISKGFPSHPAYARHLQKARENRLFARPSRMTDSGFSSYAERLWSQGGPPKAALCVLSGRSEG
ncbi:MAG: hypothetical protein AB1547_12170 [Thermodesulfobacteriota bacterium]